MEDSASFKHFLGHFFGKNCNGSTSDEWSKRRGKEFYGGLQKVAKINSKTSSDTEIIGINAAAKHDSVR